MLVPQAWRLRPCEVDFIFFVFFEEKKEYNNNNVGCD
jgi:hypothetical protein